MSGDVKVHTTSLTRSSADGARHNPRCRMTDSPYAVRRASRSQFLNVRGLRMHVLQWAERHLVSPQRPPLVMVHGWMDVGASFQFVVDALPDNRLVFALDWRGFGLSDAPGTDCYWFPDYLGYLDAV